MLPCATQYFIPTSNYFSNPLIKQHYLNWQRYHDLLARFGVPEKCRRWYARHVETLLAAIPHRQLSSLTNEEITAYLTSFQMATDVNASKLSISPSLQCAFVSRMVKSVFVVLHPHAALQPRWMCKASSQNALQKGASHPNPRGQAEKRQPETRERVSWLELCIEWRRLQLRKGHGLRDGDPVEETQTIEQTLLRIAVIEAGAVV